MKKLSVGQRKFLAEFLGNLSTAWIVGALISPYLSGTLPSISWYNIIIGIINAAWTFIIAFSLVKEVSV